MTDVAAEVGERNEDPARGGDHPGVRGIAQARGFCYQFGQRRVEPLPRHLSTGRCHRSVVSARRGSHVVAGRACRHPLAAAWCRIDASNAMEGRTQQMLIGFNAPTAGPLSAAETLLKI